MNTIIRPLDPASHSTRSPNATANVVAGRKPHYDCREQGDTLHVVVYVPGVDASGVEITTRGPDLTVTARKTHFVRVNWQSLHLEGAQRDYELRLRLGNGLDYTALQAEIRDGVLTLTLPKKQPEAFATRNDRQRKVA
jgi:HSP20 family molecular chaperone IbpA